METPMLTPSNAVIVVIVYHPMFQVILSTEKLASNHPASLPSPLCLPQSSPRNPYTCGCRGKQRASAILQALPGCYSRPCLRNLWSG